MEPKYQVEVFRRVYDNEEGHYLTVRPSPDFPDGSVCVMADPSEQEYFGDLRIDLPAAFMRQLGLALIATADEVLGPEVASE